jgi:hypothetical protein
VKGTLSAERPSKVTKRDPKSPRKNPGEVQTCDNPSQGGIHVVVGRITCLIRKVILRVCRNTVRITDPPWSKVTKGDPKSPPTNPGEVQTYDNPSQGGTLDVRVKLPSRLGR